MPKTSDGGSAFPSPADYEGGTGGSQGMTLRDYFAGQALQGLLANPSLSIDLKPASSSNEPEVAQVCLDHADELIAALRALDGTSKEV